MTLRPIDMMTADWRVKSRSPDSRVALARLAEAEEVVAALGAVDLGDVVAATTYVEGRPDGEHGARVVRAMLRSQRVHPLVPRALLQALVPGLVAIARRLSWGAGGDWDSATAFLADTLATAWQVIVEWAGQDRAYAVLDVLSAVRCRLRRQLLHQRAARERVTLGLDLDLHAAPQWWPGITDLEELARTIERRRGLGTDPLDADILYGNRVLGFSLAELAAVTGRSRRSVAYRRDRAVRGLFA